MALRCSLPARLGYMRDREYFWEVGAKGRVSFPIRRPPVRMSAAIRSTRTPNCVSKSRAVWPNGVAITPALAMTTSNGSFSPARSRRRPRPKQPGRMCEIYFF
jgi:hypothetical protein